MYAVGRLSSYISRGVYTVSGPFHPFGGAVDIIVVQQPDGSFKSSPWYVRFGKFQGVLKTKEKVVSISINGVEASFNMHLDHKGEAYFLTEDDVTEGEGLSPPSSDVEIEDHSCEEMKSQSSNFDSDGVLIDGNNGKMVERTNSRRARIFGFVFGRRSVREDGSWEVSGRRSSLERAEIAAELLEVKWSTNLGSDELILEQEIQKVNNGDENRSCDTLLDMENDIPICFPSVQNSYQSIDSSPGLPSNTEDLNVSEVFSASKNDNVNDSRQSVENYKNNLRGMLSSSVKTHGSMKPLRHEHDRIARSLPNLSRAHDSPEALETSNLHRSRSCSGSLSSTLLNEEPLKYMESFSEKGDELKQGNIAEATEIFEIYSTQPSVSRTRSSRIWPFSFRRSKSTKAVMDTTIESSDTATEVTCDSGVSIDRVGDGYKFNATKNKFRTITPTSQQIASLNLMEGKNVINFTFSTSILGEQQVDARIYLWKWNSKIVISDVDGTITKSDVLGQFMPLVGVDWTQTGVTHLFSAIKENGYHVLFLSARAISQAYRTRQFLFNINQDGKALPDGPVVISPDGLFPSLFREVIRRAPHEFKIACLEAIKALYPPDCSPFYAGFGNRDTDELSYLKVGIPKGKIFIINPKGQVAVNRLVNTRSYASLHALVNGMFPPMASHEQEDFNSWNYWKLPPPGVDL